MWQTTNDISLTKISAVVVVAAAAVFVLFESLLLDTKHNGVHT